MHPYTRSIHRRLARRVSATAHAFGILYKNLRRLAIKLDGGEAINTVDERARLARAIGNYIIGVYHGADELATRRLHRLALPRHLRARFSELVKWFQSQKSQSRSTVISINTIKGDSDGRSAGSSNSERR